MATLIDETANNVDGVIVGNPTTQAGVIGNSMGFDGFNDYVTLPDVPTMRPSVFTVTGWINSIYTGSVQDILSSYSQESSIVSGFDIKVRDTGIVQITIGSNTGITPNIDFANCTGVTPVDDGEWHFIAGTYDGTNIVVYVDGIEDASTPYANGCVYATPNYVAISARKTTAADPYKNLREVLTKVGSSSAVSSNSSQEYNSPSKYRKKLTTEYGGSQR